MSNVYCYAYPDAYPDAHPCDTATGTMDCNYPLASDVREGVDRGDGVLGTLVDFSEPNFGDAIVDFNETTKCWTTREDWTGATVTLLLFKKCDVSVVHGRLPGVVESASEICVDLDESALSGIEFCGCPPVAELAFALVVTAEIERTIQRGLAYVYGRPEVEP